MLFGVCFFPTVGGGYMTEKNNFIRRETLTIIHVWVLHSIVEEEFSSFSVYGVEGLKAFLSTTFPKWLLFYV